jgi:RNA polymerase sigma factor (sigma-70 family)
VTVGKLHDVVLRAAGVTGRFADASDGDLLGRYIADRDTAAFGEIVRRHGSMVQGVVRRELDDTSDADDACQAVFVVLARKAATVRRADAVGAWLYAVARRLARKQGRMLSRRRRRETPLTDVPGADTTAAAGLRDGLRLLDEELARLPDGWRAPIVLCYLEGRTQDEAARQLGWSLGMVRGRLERGRARLRDRLTRRGVGLAVLAAASVARPGSISAAAQASIINTAAAVAAGEALSVPAVVAVLAEGAIRAMTVTKLQWAAGVAAVSGLLIVGGVWATGQGPVDPAAGVAPPQVHPVPRDPRSAAPQFGGEPPAVKQSEMRTATAALRKKSMNNLKQIMLAIHNYHDAHGHLPADVRDRNGKVVLSWRVAILPFLEQDALYQKFHLDEPWDSEHNLKLLSQMPAVYRIGFEPKDSTHTYYQVFAAAGRVVPLHDAGGAGDLPDLNGPGGGLPVIPGPAGGPPGRFVPGMRPGGPVPPTAPGPMQQPAGPVRIGEIVDGTSNTLGVVEAAPPVAWTKPADIPFDPQKPSVTSPFVNEWHAAMMDGSAHAFKPDIDPDVLRRLIVMNDGEQVSSLNKLHVARLAETPEDRAALRQQIGRNHKLVDEVHQLMGELVDQLAGPGGRAGDIGAEEEIADELKQMAKRLRDQINKVKGGSTTAPEP